MANSLAESGLHDFLDSFLSHPLDFQARHGANTFYPTQQVQTPLERDMNLHAMNAEATTTNNAYSGGVSHDMLKAESFTDVLANVATDWIPQDAANMWGGSFMVGGDWNFGARDNLRSSIPQPNGSLPRSADLPDTSSNNSAEKGRGFQVCSPMQGLDGFDSDRESEEGQAEQPHAAATSGKSKATASGKAEQRRVRKREKDRIEELQASIKKAQEERAQLESLNSELAKELQGKDDQLRKLRAAEESALPAADDDDLAASYEGHLLLTVQGGKEMKLKSEQELLQAGALSEQGAEQQQVMQRVNQLQREATLISIRSALSNMAIVKKLLAKGRLDKKQEECIPPGFWQKVMKDLNLSSSQQEAVSELCRTYQLRVSKLLDVRSSIHKHMQETMPDGVFGRSFAVNFLKAHELMDALKYNLRQEHIVLCDVAATFHKILSPIQNASCIVHSWPYWPNIPRLLHLPEQNPPELVLQNC